MAVGLSVEAAYFTRDRANVTDWLAVEKRIWVAAFVEIGPVLARSRVVVGACVVIVVGERGVRISRSCCRCYIDCCC